MATFVSQILTPLDESFDTRGMAIGEPGVPRRFRWNRKEFETVEILERWKEYGDCMHGSGERYLRKHGYRIRIDDGRILKIYFQRHFGRSHRKTAARWWIHSVESDPSS